MSFLHLATHHNNLDHPRQIITAPSMYNISLKNYAFMYTVANPENQKFKTETNTSRKLQDKFEKHWLTASVRIDSIST